MNVQSMQSYHHHQNHVCVFQKYQKMPVIHLNNKMIVDVVMIYNNMSMKYFFVIFLQLLQNFSIGREEIYLKTVLNVVIIMIRVAIFINQ